jgi:hypothetical protein
MKQSEKGARERTKKHRRCAVHGATRARLSRETKNDLNNVQHTRANCFSLFGIIRDGLVTLVL